MWVFVLEAVRPTAPSRSRARRLAAVRSSFFASACSITLPSAVRHSSSTGSGHDADIGARAGDDCTVNTDGTVRGRSSPPRS